MFRVKKQFLISLVSTILLSGCYDNNHTNIDRTTPKTIKHIEDINLSPQDLNDILSYNYNFDTFIYEDKNNTKELSREFLKKSTLYLKNSIYNDIKEHYKDTQYGKVTEDMIDSTYHLLGVNWFFAIENDPISDKGYLTLLDNLTYEMNLLSPENYKKNIDFILKLYKDGLSKVNQDYPLIRKLNPSQIYSIKYRIESKLKNLGIDKEQITPQLLVKKFSNIKKEYIEGLGKIDDLFYIKLFASAMQHQGLEPKTQEHIDINIEELLE